MRADILQWAAIEESRRGRKGVDWDDKLKRKAKRIARLYSASFGDDLVRHEAVRPKCLPDLKSQARRVKMKGCDLERALERVSRIALTYRPEKVPGLKACLMKELTIDDLKDMLFRNFRLRMPLGELVALFKYMDADGSGSISYVEFLVFLTRLSIKEKSAEKLRVATLIQCGAARMCKTPSDLAGCTSDWMMEAENRAKAGAQAAQWVNTHGGAALRIAKAIEAAR